MALRPCVDCGELVERGARCTACAPPVISHTTSTTARGYDYAWRRLSERARAAQPWCSDCGTTEHLTTDHKPEAWRRKARGLEIRLRDVDVVCNDCNANRGSSRPGTPRADQGDGPHPTPKSTGSQRTNL